MIMTQTRKATPSPVTEKLLTDLWAEERRQPAQNSGPGNIGAQRSIP